MTIAESYEEVATAQGPMRVHLFFPNGADRYPGVIFYSEIFQVTGPIRRLAAQLAGHGYVVAVPEVYHEFLPAGTVLDYDQAGSDRGNQLKYEKELSSYDADAAACVTLLQNHARCNGRLGSYGVCLGGHLAVRAGFQPAVQAVAAFYPTDLHTGAGQCKDTLERLETTKADFLFVWGRQDPHVPREGRQKIAERLHEAGLNFEWHEFNAAHAFLRDEGPRYNPALASVCQQLLLRFFGETLGGAR